MSVQRYAKVGTQNLFLPSAHNGLLKVQGRNHDVLTCEDIQFALSVSDFGKTMCHLQSRNRQRDSITIICKSGICVPNYTASQAEDHNLDTQHCNYLKTHVFIHQKGNTLQVIKSISL